MAATYLTIDTVYKPYTYEQYLAPLLALEAQHRELEDAYDEYSNNVDNIASYLDPVKDRELIDNYIDPYRRDLQKSVDNLVTTGVLSPGNREALSRVRRRYGRDINPINNAITARAAAQKLYDEMYSKNPTLMTNHNPYYEGVSAYMNGRSPKTIYVSGNELFSRGQALSKALSNVLRKVPSGENLALGDQYFRIAQETGFNSDEMKDFLNIVVKTNPELERQIKKIMQSSGIYSEGFTEADINRAEQYIIEGMASGMSGETKVDYLQNRAWDLAAKAYSEKLEEPYGVMTITGGIDSNSNPDLDRRYSILEQLSYNNNGGYNTPELLDIKDRIKNNPAKDLILKDLSIIEQVEGEIGTPQEAKGYSSGLASFLANPDFVKRDSNGAEVSRMSYDEAKKALGNRFSEYENAKKRQRHESSAFKDSVEQSYYMTNQSDYRALVDAQNTIDELVGIGKLISSDNASDVELKSNIKRYLDYERVASSLESRTIVPQFKNPSEESAYVNNLLNAAIGSLKNHQYSAVEIVDDKGNTRAITGKEAEKLLPLLQDSSKFAITGNLNPMSKKENRNSGLEVTFTGDSSNAPTTFIIHEDSLDAALRHTNRIYDHLTDFSINKIRNPQVISGAQYNSPDLIYNIKWSEEKDGVRTATVKDRETGEVYNYVAFVDKGSNGAPVQKVVRTTIDDVAYGRGYLSGDILQNNIIRILNNLRVK